MRIRTIKPEFFLHFELAKAEKETGLPLRIAYIGLWCASDRSGRFKWEPERLGIQIIPFDGVEFSRVLDALVTRGWIVKYAVEGRTYGCVPSFSKHQFVNNKEKPSELPEPTNQATLDATGTRDERENDAKVTEGVKEGKGKEGKGRDLHANPKTESAAATAAFDTDAAEKLPPAKIQPQRPKTREELLCDYLYAKYAEIGDARHSGVNMDGWKNPPIQEKEFVQHVFASKPSLTSEGIGELIKFTLKGDFWRKKANTPYNFAKNLTQIAADYATQHATQNNGHK